jgi:hypothetical protein
MRLVDIESFVQWSMSNASSRFGAAALYDAYMACWNPRKSCLVGYRTCCTQLQVSKRDQTSNLTHHLWLGTGLADCASRNRPDSAVAISTILIKL